MDENPTPGPAATPPPSGPSPAPPSTPPPAPPYTGGYAGGGYAGGPGDGTGPQGPPPRPPGPRAASFFDQVRGMGMVRPDDRVAAGVAAAVAGRLGIDPLLVRVGFVVLTVLGGIGVLAYGLGWLFLPQQDGRIHAQAVLAGDVTAGLVGSVVVVLLGLGSFGPPTVWGGEMRFDGLGDVVGFLSVAALVVLVVLAWRYRWFDRSGGATADHGAAHGAGSWATTTDQVDLSKGGEPVDLGKPGSASAPPPVPPAPPRAPVPPRPVRPRRRPPGPLGTLLALGLALVGAGAVVVLDDVVGLPGHVAAVATATALAVLALFLVVLGLAGRRSGGVGGLAVLALVVATTTGGATGALDSNDTGSRTWVPTESRPSWEYRLAAGDAELDLTDLRPGGRVTEIETDLSIGSLRVVVPDDLAVDLVVVNGVGDVTGASEGTNRIGASGPADVELSVDVSVGHLLVEEVSR